jgi:hypothetical protein
MEAAMSTDFQDDAERTTSGMLAEGMSALAGVLLVISAIADILQGMAAIDGGDLYLHRVGYLYHFDLTAWGWVHIVIGVLCLVVAIGILRKAAWGQLTGIIVASLSVLTNFAFLPNFPLWSGLVIGFDILVIWALCTQLSRRA